jgi:hypothetical protein
MYPWVHISQERDLLCHLTNFPYLEHNAYFHKIVYSYWANRWWSLLIRPFAVVWKSCTSCPRTRRQSNAFSFGSLLLSFCGSFCSGAGGFSVKGLLAPRLDNSPVLVKGFHCWKGWEGKQTIELLLKLVAYHNFELLMSFSLKKRAAENRLCCSVWGQHLTGIILTSPISVSGETWHLQAQLTGHRLWHHTQLTAVTLTCHVTWNILENLMGDIRCCPPVMWSLPKAWFV